MVCNGVVSPAAATKSGKDFRNHPVGTGPFVFNEWRHHDQMILDANPNYWGGKPKVDRLIFKYQLDAQASLLALPRQGDVHILAHVNSQLVLIKAETSAGPGRDDLAGLGNQRHGHALRHRALQ